MTITRFSGPIFVAAALAFAAGTVANHVLSAAHAGPAPLASNATTVQTLPDFAVIAAEQGAAVVNISVSGNRKTAAAQIDPNSPFFEFFRRFQAPQGDVPVRGQGSGFITSSDGVVLTNAHLVADAREVTVKLTDKREFAARVVAIDKATDVAVLRIDARDLPAVKIGDSRRVRVGEWVLAIGSPFGFENTVTAGIVSAKSRSLPEEGYVPFLQTDVAINPGNSGGPLFNMAGEVIGINSQIYSRSGGYQGLSFAIPIEVAMKVERQLLANGKVSRGRLGITVQEVTGSLAESFGLARPSGALVNSVEAQGPAERAGLKAGDVILKLNSQDIASSADLPPMVSDLAPGTPATLEVWRDGHARTLTLTVGEVNSTVAQAVTRNEDKGRLGLTVRPLTPEERKGAALTSGLVVEDVSGPAARAGLEPGDVIISANGSPLTTAESLRALGQKSGKHVALLVQRGEQRMFVSLDLS